MPDDADRLDTLVTDILLPQCQTVVISTRHEFGGVSGGARCYRDSPGNPTVHSPLRRAGLSQRAEGGLAAARELLAAPRVGVEGGATGPGACASTKLTPKLERRKCRA